MAYEERKVDIAFGVSEFKITVTKNRKPVSDRKVSLELRYCCETWYIGIL